MIVALAIAALISAGAAQATVSEAPTAIVSATKFDLAFSGGRVRACVVKATSGNPKVDQYICESARACADRFSDADRRAACLTDKRNALVDRIAKNPDWLKW